MGGRGQERTAAQTTQQCGATYKSDGCVCGVVISNGATSSNGCVCGAVMGNDATTSNGCMCAAGGAHQCGRCTLQNALSVAATAATNNGPPHAYVLPPVAIAAPAGATPATAAAAVMG